eukprot:UN18390
MPHIWDEINDIDHETLIHGDTFIPNIVFPNVQTDESLT